MRPTYSGRCALCRAPNRLPRLQREHRCAASTQGRFYHTQDPTHHVAAASARPATGTGCYTSAATATTRRIPAIVSHGSAAVAPATRRATTRIAFPIGLAKSGKEGFDWTNQSDLKCPTSNFPVQVAASISSVILVMLARKLVVPPANSLSSSHRHRPWRQPYRPRLRSRGCRAALRRRHLFRPCQDEPELALRRLQKNPAH